MVKFETENVLQTADGDLTIGVGCGKSCCEGRFFLNVYGDSPRTYNKMSLTREDLKKLKAIIDRLDSAPKTE
jgi:hypothetical protein